MEDFTLKNTGTIFELWGSKIAPILTITGNGQVLLFNTPFFLIIGISLVIGGLLTIFIGASLIYLWMPKT